ncbi:hypothetical protein OHA72_59280 [Dactylosporangium sp. NBC_01737]|uniref:hypothetical protein n=1 Tax=Dactylosporangium sp. NBC_01737 TaxID=2975959 RepID=UPI002E0D8967|nr:hypothetical protein OHA72_59280 [Dactylosporangium sp. NBC_01737]
MDRDVFAARFAASAAAARDLARAAVLEPLPERLLFRVRLNQSYDGNPPVPGEVRYPEDSSRDRAVALHRCDAETALAELWRDGRVPQWINLGVVSETGDATLVEAVCCGRFFDDEDMLYHAPTGPPPFNVCGPVLPFGRRDVPFSIHALAECWDAADLRRIAAAPERVESLHLMTAGFDAALPDLPNLEILDHRMWTLGDLSAFARFPKLRLLRLHVAADGVQVCAARSLDALEDLTITGLPATPWGSLAGVLPAVTTMALHAPGALRLDGAVPRSLRTLRITAGEVAGPATLPDGLDSLDLHIAHGTDRDVERLLGGVTRLRSLDLSGTPVTDAVIPVLDRLDLQVLDLRRTAVTDAALDRFREERPGVRLHPYVPPPGYVPPPSPYDGVTITVDERPSSTR